MVARIIGLNVRWIVLLIAIGTSAFCQAPLGFNYQGVARNLDGSPMTERAINIRVSILDGGVSGIVEYSEIHRVVTNQFGLFTLVIGQGENTGNIQDVNWSTGNKWLQIEMDTDGGNAFDLIGAQQILSVPYAMYAASSGNTLESGEGINISGNTIENTAPDQTVTMLGSGNVVVSGNYPDFIVSGTDNVNDADSDPSNELQVLSREGTDISLSRDGGAVSVEDDDPDPANEIQDASQVEVVPAGNLVSTDVQSALTELQDEIDLDTDQDPANEIQNLNSSASGTDRTISISGGMGTTISVADLDNDPANEIQDLSSSENGTERTINISSGTGTTIDVADQDNDVSNELQSLSQVGNTVTLSDGGGSVTVDDGDADPANEIQDLESVLIQNNDAGGNVITGLADPVGSSDAVTKNYLDVKDATDYAFKSIISDNGTGSPLTFDLSSTDFDEGSLISTSQITILETGIYLFNVKGSSTMNAPIVINVNGITDYTIGLINVNKYFDTILLKLNSGDIIELRANSTSSGEGFTLEFFGFKI